jgi:hypothetical protein
MLGQNKFAGAALSRAKPADATVVVVPHYRSGTHPTTLSAGPGQIQRFSHNRPPWNDMAITECRDDAR